MKGKVYLVGAGPGDFKLITFKGMELLKKAEVLVYDRLINKRYLKEVKEDCELIYVGKKPNNHIMKQNDINKILVDKAREGKIVVRLKGGDPYVFGRGGEEGQILYDNNVNFEVVPGITSTIGGLTYGGIPITHRDYSSSFHVFTGHTKNDDELNFETIAKLKGTLVFVMGMKNLPNIAQDLIHHGMNSDTPVAIIHQATTSNQKVLVGTLNNIYQKVKEEGISSPSLIVIGDVVKLRDKLNFFEEKQLLGKNIIVTRSRSQNSSLLEKIEALGGNSIELPTIKIEKIEKNEKLKDVIKNLKNYSYIIFTSVNGIKIFFEELFEMGYDSRVLKDLKIVSIGKSTNKLLRDYGLISDITPEKSVSESLVDELKGIVNENDNILIPRGNQGREYLIEELEKFCAVEEVVIYNTVIEDKDIEVSSFIKVNKIDYITFTSSSTVKNFIKILGLENIHLLKKTKIISIGPITSKTIEDFNLQVYKEAQESTINGIIESLVTSTKEE